MLYRESHSPTGINSAITSSLPKPFCADKHRAVREQMRDRSERLARLAGFGGDDTEVKLGQLLRIGYGLQVALEIRCVRSRESHDH